MYIEISFFGFSVENRKLCDHQGRHAILDRSGQKMMRSFSRREKMS